jgi:hypothetical protein
MWLLIIMMSSTGLLYSAEQVALPRIHALWPGTLFDASFYRPTGARIADPMPRNTVAACTKLCVVHALDVTDSYRPR